MSSSEKSSKIPVAAEHSLMSEMELYRLSRQGDKLAEIELNSRKVRREVQSKPSQSSKPAATPTSIKDLSTRGEYPFDNLGEETDAKAYRRDPTLKALDEAVMKLLPQSLKGKPRGPQTSR